MVSPRTRLGVAGPASASATPPPPPKKSEPLLRGRPKRLARLNSYPGMDQRGIEAGERMAGGPRLRVRCQPAICLGSHKNAPAMPPACTRKLRLSYSTPCIRTYLLTFLYDGMRLRHPVRKKGGRAAAWGPEHELLALVPFPATLGWVLGPMDERFCAQLKRGRGANRKKKTGLQWLSRGGLEWLASKRRYMICLPPAGLRLSLNAVP